MVEWDQGICMCQVYTLAHTHVYTHTWTQTCRQTHIHFLCIWSCDLSCYLGILPKWSCYQVQIFSLVLELEQQQQQQKLFPQKLTTQFVWLYHKGRKPNKDYGLGQSVSFHFHSSQETCLPQSRYIITRYALSLSYICSFYK